MNCRLIDTNKFPPGGFPYREAALNWTAPNYGLPFSMIVEQIQAVRAHNPASGLNPSYAACALALETYTCARLKCDPQWCWSEEGRMAAAVRRAASTPLPCATCGGRR